MKAAAILFLAMGIFLIGCSGANTINNTALAYRDTFSANPPPGVSNVLGQISGERDSATCYLRFNCSSNIFYVLISPSFNSIGYAQFTAKCGGFHGIAPSWWSPPAHADFLYSTGFHSTYFQGQSFAAYDTSNSTAYIYWDGLD